jgi:hypothetical protein
LFNITGYVNSSSSISDSDHLAFWVPRGEPSQLFSVCC